MVNAPKKELFDSINIQIRYAINNLIICGLRLFFSLVVRCPFDILSVSIIIPILMMKLYYISYFQVCPITHVCFLLVKYFVSRFVLQGLVHFVTKYSSRCTSKNILILNTTNTIVIYYFIEVCSLCFQLCKTNENCFSLILWKLNRYCSRHKQNAHGKYHWQF